MMQNTSVIDVTRSGDMQIEYFDSIIQTQGIKVSLHMSEYDTLPEPIIKQKLVTKLAEAILEKKLCEFTMVKSHIDFTTMYMIRAYMTPQEQCKILRQANPLIIGKGWKSQ